MDVIGLNEVLFVIEAYLKVLFVKEIFQFFFQCLGFYL